MLRWASRRGFPAPAMATAPSRCGRSGFIIDGEAVIPGHRASDEPGISRLISRFRVCWLRQHPGMTVNRMTPTEIEKIFRDEAGRALATLIRLVGDFDLAEDVLQEAFATALERWPAQELPANPRAWLVNVGRNKAIDRIRREIAFRGKQEELTHELLLNAAASDEVGDTTALDDDMLR